VRLVAKFGASATTECSAAGPSPTNLTPTEANPPAWASVRECHPTPDVFATIGVGDVLMSSDGAARYDGLAEWYREDPYRDETQ
jgi:hypothetical protein